MIEPDSITVKGLQSGKFLGTLPELYELKEVKENNKWHNHDSVFSHTISVLKNLERLLKKNPLPVSRRLQKIIGKHSSRQLLFLAAVLHDIAKKETIIRHFLKTDCPHHEEKGAIKSKKILRRFSLSAKEKEFVTSIVKFHGEAHKTIDMGKKSFEKFRKKRDDVNTHSFIFSPGFVE